MINGSYFGLEDFRIASRQFDGWSFWGFNCEGCSCNNTASCSRCKRILYEFHWQNSRLSRDDLRLALREAENYALQITRIPVGNQWFEETVTLPRYYDARHQFVMTRDTVCLYPAVQLCNNYLQALGIPQYELLGTVDVVYTTVDGAPAFPPDGDPLCPYTFTVTLPAPDPLPPLDEIQVHHATANRPEDCPVDNDTWIRPAKVVYDVGTDEIVVTGRAWMMGNPLKWVTPDACPLDCRAPESFVDQVEIYHLSNVTNGTTFDDASVVLLSEASPCGCGCCFSYASVAADPATTTATLGRGGVRTGKTGLAYVGEAVYDQDNETWSGVCCSCNESTKAIIRYKAGLSKSACQGDYSLTIAKLTAGVLFTLCPGCCGDEGFLSYWATDLGEKDDDNEDIYNFTVNDLNNPIAPTRGAIRAYRELQRMRVGRGVVIQ